MIRDAFCHIHRVKNAVSKGLGPRRRDGGAMKETSWVGLPQGAVSDWTVANLRAKCCSQNWGHVECKPKGVNEIWLIPAEIHHRQSAESPVLPNMNGSLLEFIGLWGIIALEYCMPPCACARVQAENTAKKWHFNSIVQNESPKFGSESQVYPYHSNMVMVIFTLFEILYYVRYFQLPLLNTQYIDFNVQYLHCHRHYSFTLKSYQP